MGFPHLFADVPGFNEDGGIGIGGAAVVGAAICGGSPAAVLVGAGGAEGGVQCQVGGGAVGEARADIAAGGVVADGDGAAAGGVTGAAVGRLHLEVWDGVGVAYFVPFIAEVGVGGAAVCRIVVVVAIIIVIIGGVSGRVGRRFRFR